jgi:hypothetical protein
MDTRTDQRSPEYKEADQKAAPRDGLSSVRARQGVGEHNARYILGYGLVAIIVAFIRYLSRLLRLIRN